MDERGPCAARKGRPERRAGGRWGPCTSVRPPDRQIGLAVRVSGAATVATGEAALLPVRQVRTLDVDHRHDAVAELDVEPLDDGRGEQLQLGGPGRRVGADDQSCLGQRLGRAMEATSSPTSSAQRPNTACTRRSSSQPCWLIMRDIAESRSWGSRSSGWAPDDLGTVRRRNVSPPVLRRAPCPGRSRRPSARTGRSRARRRDGSGTSTSSGPACSSGSGSRQRIAAYLTVGDQEPDPLQRLRHVRGDRGGDQHLLGAGDELGELCATLGVQLGEDVVEHQDRVVAVGAEQVVRRQPHRQGEGPRLPVRGIALHRQPQVAVAQGQHQLVAVRADQGDARSSSSLRRRSSSASSASSSVRRGLAARARVEGRLVVDLGIVTTGAAGDCLVGLAEVGTQVLDQADPGREQLAAHAGQLQVPHGQRRERGFT